MSDSQFKYAALVEKLRAQGTMLLSKPPKPDDKIQAADAIEHLERLLAAWVDVADAAIIQMQYHGKGLKQSPRLKAALETAQQLMRRP